MFVGGISNAGLTCGPLVGVWPIFQTVVGDFQRRPCVSLRGGFSIIRWIGAVGGGSRGVRLAGGNGYLRVLLLARSKSDITSENTAAMAESNLHSFCSVVASVLLLKGLVAWKSLMVALVSRRSMATECNILASTACEASTMWPTTTTKKNNFF